MVGPKKKRGVLTQIEGGEIREKVLKTRNSPGNFGKDLQFEKKILKWVPKKTSNPEKYWLKIPEILGLEIYEEKNGEK